MENIVAGNEGKLKHHVQPITLAPSQDIPHHPPPPPPTHSLMHAFASPPRHQLRTPDCL
jgi:hypothetical protein